MSRKAQEGHVEEGKLQKPTKGTKSGKAKQNGKEEQENLKRARKALTKAKTQNQHSPPEINSP
jgi:hypothetical protein